MSNKPTVELQPLQKEITDEIRNILEECRDGKRLHNQGYFATKNSCGTAHCIAGWKVFGDFKNIITYSKFANDMFDMVIDGCDPEDFNEWNYAKKSWTLTGCEADILFDACATFEEQFSLLERLECGERLSD